MMLIFFVGVGDVLVGSAEAAYHNARHAALGDRVV